MALLNEYELSQFNDYLIEHYGSIDPKDGTINKKYEAITTCDSNILLSAGAGCGKTTTLSLRVLYQILIKEISVSEMLILTFTDNAAREMKDRITNDLKEFATNKEKYPFINKEASKVLLDEAEKVAIAQISTFDSFSNSIVRKYADKLHISPTFTILDGAVSDYIFNKIENEAINNEFLNPGQLEIDYKGEKPVTIQEFFDRNVSTNNESLKEMIATIEKIRDSEMDANYLLDNWEKLYLNNDVYFKANVNLLLEYCLRTAVLSIVLNNFINNYVDVREANDDENSTTFFKKASQRLLELAKKYIEYCDRDRPDFISINHYELIQNFILELDTISFSSNKKLPENYIRPFNRSWWKEEVLPFCSVSEEDDQLLEKQKKAIIDYYKKIKADLKSILPSEVTHQWLLSEKRFINYAIGLDKDIHKKVEEIKNKNNAYSFADISRMCLNLLENDDEVREEEKERIKSIMVDEYQDSNPAQETLLILLGTSEDNLALAKEAKAEGKLDLADRYHFDRNIVFLVGDVKQSIYAFRNARPDLFLAKYKQPGYYNFKVLTMKDNYRSDSIVVNEVNNFFKVTMTQEVGDVNYEEDSNQHIKASNRNYDNITVGDYSEIHSYEYDFDDPKRKGPKIKKESLKKSIAALDIAKKIKKWVEEGKMKVVEKKDGSKRDMTYGDFSILVRAKSQAAPYIKAFTSLNIPCVLDFNQDFKMSSVVIALENLIKLEHYLILLREGKELTIEQKKSYKRCVASIERSFLLNVKDYQIVEDMKHLFDLNESRPLVLKMLDEINNDGDFSIKSTNQIVREILKKFDVYYKISTLPDPDEILASYNFFFSKYLTFLRLIC